MASCCFAHCIFHIISIPFNRSDTAIYKSCQSYDSRKSYNFVFRPGCFVSRISRQNSFRPFSSREPGWNFSYEPKLKLVPVTGNLGQQGSCEEALVISYRIILLEPFLSKWKRYVGDKAQKVICKFIGKYNSHWHVVILNNLYYLQGSW